MLPTKVTVPNCVQETILNGKKAAEKVSEETASFITSASADREKSWAPSAHGARASAKRFSRQISSATKAKLSQSTNNQKRRKDVKVVICGRSITQLTERRNEMNAINMSATNGLPAVTDLDLRLVDTINSFLFPFFGQDTQPERSSQSQRSEPK